MAEQQEISVTRESFLNTVNTLIARLEQLDKLTSVDNLYERLSVASELCGDLEAWARVEGRRLIVSGKADPAPLPEAWNSMLQAAKTAADVVDTFPAAVERLRSQVTKDDLHKKEILFNGMGEHALVANREAMAVRIALLGKIAGNNDFVISAFRVFGGHISSYKSADEFLRAPHDIPTIFNLPPPVATSAAQSKPTITSEMQEAIKDLVRRYFEAVKDKDAIRLQQLFDDKDAVTNALSKLAESPRILSVNLDNAQYSFEPVGNGVVLVDIEGIRTRKIKDGVEKELVGRKGLRVVVRGKDLKFQFKAGDQ